MCVKSSSRASVSSGNTTSELACRTGYSYSFVCIGRVYIHPVYWSYLRFFSCGSSGNEEQDLLRNTYNFFLVFKVLGLKKSQKKQKQKKIFRNGLTRTLFFCTYHTICVRVSLEMLEVLFHPLPFWPKMFLGGGVAPYPPPIN